MISSINITLDLTKAYTAPIELVQGEKLARRLYFTVTNGGVLIDMTGKAVCLQITKPDGTSCLIQASVTAVGKCYVDLTAQAVAADGNAKCQLIIMTAEAMGSAASGTATSMYDTTKTWTVNEFADKSLYIYAGTGAGQIRNIASNTATQLTVDTAWTVNPGAGSSYAIISESGLSFPFAAHITASDDVATAAESTDEFSALVAALATVEEIAKRNTVKSVLLNFVSPAAAGTLRVTRCGNTVQMLAWCNRALSTTAFEVLWETIPVGYRPAYAVDNEFGAAHAGSTLYTTFAPCLFKVGADGVVSVVSTAANKTGCTLNATWTTGYAYPA